MKRNWSAACAMLAAVLGNSAMVRGQAAAHVESTESGKAVAAAEFAGTPSRVVARIDEASRVTLTGNTHYLARKEFDRGLADLQLPLERMVLVLERSPAQEAALKRFMDEQYDPKSANFHHWLEPEEFGRLYGPSDDDMAAVTNWLEVHGFRIYRVSKGRVTIEFSGTAGQVQEAFHTEIHRYEMKGEQHIANDRDPQIPSALAPVVKGIASLNDFFPRHQSKFGGFVKRDRKTGKITEFDGKRSGPGSKLSYTDSSSRVHNDVTPFDFATIYNLLPLWNNGITGSGQKIAISAVSDVLQSDIDTFRSSFGLPSSTISVIHNGADPGVVAGATVENTLDVQWSGAAAPAATVVLVVSGTQGTTFGGQLSDSYIVDNKVATITSASYGNCEAGIGNAGNAALNKIYQQGSAEGISMFVSSGDQGSTGCDSSNSGAPATHGLQVNGWASSPYVTGVGGTDFNVYTNTNRTTYWNNSNSSTGATAKGYIPELPWNATCTSYWLLVGNPTFASSEALCLAVAISPVDDNLVKVTGGSGGVCSCTNLPAGATSISQCAGGYAKPGWQSVAGVPPDGKRDVPDVSLFAAGGWPDGITGSAYLLCVAANDPNGCDYSDPSYIIYQEVGGTSVSSPAMAGIMALVQQKMGGKGQGLANPELYSLFSKESVSGCATDSVKSGNKCIFYDITAGTNAQVCNFGSINCVPDGVEPLGIVSGYNSNVGYDLTTGLGSVNAANLVNAWSSAQAPAATLSATKLTFPSTKVGASSAAQTVTLENSGVATMTISSGGITIAGADASSFPKATTCGATLAAGASCKITIEFKPQAAGALSATLEIADNASGSPQKVTLAGTGASAGSVALTPAVLSFPNTEAGSTSIAQVVTVSNSTASAVTIKSISFGGSNPSAFVEENNCGATLAAKASCLVIVAFKPGSAASLKATLSVADSASGSPQTVALSGTGMAKPAVKLSKTSLAFASTAKGKSAPEQSVTLTNGGKTPLDITGITIGGTNATSFSQLNTCPATLAPAANCLIYVDFIPAAAGTLKASVVIADNGSTATQTITLTGTGH